MEGGLVFRRVPEALNTRATEMKTVYLLSLLLGVVCTTLACDLNGARIKCILPSAGTELDLVKSSSGLYPNQPIMVNDYVVADGSIRSFSAHGMPLLGGQFTGQFEYPTGDFSLYMDGKVVGIDFTPCSINSPALLSTSPAATPATFSTYGLGGGNNYLYVNVVLPPGNSTYGISSWICSGYAASAGDYTRIYYGSIMGWKDPSDQSLKLVLVDRYDTYSNGIFKVYYKFENSNGEQLAAPVPGCHSAAPTIIPSAMLIMLGLAILL